MIAFCFLCKTFLSNDALIVHLYNRVTLMLSLSNTLIQKCSLNTKIEEKHFSVKSPQRHYLGHHINIRLQAEGIH